MNGEERQLDYREKLHSTPIHIIERRFVRDSWSGGVAPLRCQCKRGRWGRNQMLSAQLSPHMSWMMAKTRRCSSSGTAWENEAWQWGDVPWHGVACPATPVQLCHRITHNIRGICSTWHLRYGICSAWCRTIRKHFKILQRKIVDPASVASPAKLRRTGTLQVDGLMLH